MSLAEPANIDVAAQSRLARPLRTNENAPPRGRAFSPPFACGPGQAESTEPGSTLTPGPMLEVTAMRWM